MGEFIELIGQLKPKNNGNFPIADVNDLRGSLVINFKLPLTNFN